MRVLGVGAWTREATRFLNVGASCTRSDSRGNVVFTLIWHRVFPVGPPERRLGEAFLVQTWCYNSHGLFRGRDAADRLHCRRCGAAGGRIRTWVFVGAPGR